MTDHYRVATRRPTRQTRRGLALIDMLLVEEFDNAFQRLFPQASDQDIMDVCDAMSWLEQYIDEEL
jgi:hypothetical protein